MTPRLRVGLQVLYHEHGMPPRAAIVGNVHADGRTCDLVVFCDGADPFQWALGHGVTRARTAIACLEDDPANVRHWYYAPALDPRAGLHVGMLVDYSEAREERPRPGIVGALRTGRVVDLCIFTDGVPEHRACVVP